MLTDIRGGLMGKRTLTLSCTVCHRQWTDGHADVCLGPCPGCAGRDARIVELEAVADAAREFMLPREHDGKCEKLCAALSVAGR